MKPAAVVLDLDGLMIDTESIARKAWQAAAVELGYVIEDELFSTFIGRRDPDCDAELLARFGDVFPIDAFRSKRNEVWRKLVEEHGIPPRPGLMELLAAVENHMLPTAIATSSFYDSAMFKLSAAGLAGRFSILVTGDQIVRGKPDPDIYLKAATHLGVAPDQCVALEDSTAGVLAASRAGMITLLVPDDGAVPPQEAREAAYRVITSLHEAIPIIVELLGEIAPR